MGSFNWNSEFEEEFTRLRGKEKSVQAEGIVYPLVLRVMNVHGEEVKADWDHKPRGSWRLGVLF